MKILELQGKYKEWAWEIRKIPPMEKWYFLVEDRVRVQAALSSLSRKHGLKYVTKHMDSKYFVLIILEEWQ